MTGQLASELGKRKGRAVIHPSQGRTRRPGGPFNAGASMQGHSTLNILLQNKEDDSNSISGLSHRDPGFAVWQSERPASLLSDSL